MMQNTKNGQTIPQKPMCLRVAEFEKEFVNMVSDAAARGIPFYLIEPIAHSVARQVTDYADAEREAAKQIYSKELEQYEANEVGDDGLGTRKEAD